jgi:hypothetical protein
MTMVSLTRFLLLPSDDRLDRLANGFLSDVIMLIGLQFYAEAVQVTLEEVFC